jgi:hypothetical protein
MFMQIIIHIEFAFFFIGIMDAYFYHDCLLGVIKICQSLKLHTKSLVMSK